MCDVRALRRVLRGPSSQTSMSRGTCVASGSMLTKLQRKALLLIEAEVERTGGVAPTVRELAQQLGFRSATTAQRLLVGLEERGFVRRLAGKDRAIEVLRPVSRFATFRFDDTSKRLRRTSN